MNRLSSLALPAPLATALLLALLWTTPRVTDAAPKAETVKAGKAATALVVVPRLGFGSAFCIDEQGVFITNEHVIRGIKLGGQVTLVLNSAQNDQRVVQAQVVKFDRAGDLAMLVVENSKPTFPTLGIGRTDQLVETAEVVTFGYPFGTALKAKERDYPAISINVGRVTSLRRGKDNLLDAIQLDAQVNEGNSGGPVLDTKGNVIGVISKGIVGRGVNFAIPADKVRQFIAKPQLMFIPPKLTKKNQHDEHELEAKVISLDSLDKDQFDVTIVIRVNDNSPRSLKPKRDKDGVYRIKTVIVPKDKQVKTKISYMVTAKRKGKVLAIAVGRIDIDIAVAKDTTVAKHNPDVPTVRIPSGPKTKLPDDKAELAEPTLVIELPEAFTNYVVGGAGRYMLFHLKTAKKILVIDVVKGKLAFEIPKVNEDVLIAAGRDKFVLVLPGQSLIQRWNFETKTREKVGRLAVTGTPRLAIMGENSEGPLLIGAQKAKLFDLETLKPLDIDEVHIVGSQDRFPHHVCVSADGHVFTAIPKGLGPVGYTRMIVSDGRVFNKGFDSTSHNTRWAQPTADGSLVLMNSGHRIWDALLNYKETKSLHDWITFHTVDPRWFIAVRFDHDQSTKQHVTRINFCTVADRRIVHTYTGLPEMAPKGNSGAVADIIYRLRTGQGHFHYVPWAQLVVNMHWDRKRIFLRKFSLIESLNSTGIDYLFVTSVPPVTADAGKTFTHQIEAVSKAGKVEYKLESAPDGMTISPKGEIAWPVPATETAGPHNVILLVSDKSGEELFHTFDLHVVQKTATIRIDGD